MNIVKCNRTNPITIQDYDYALTKELFTLEDVKKERDRLQSLEFVNKDLLVDYYYNG